jgi:hypothetical protein
MYIVFETVASNDPRITREIKYHASVWHYTICRIDSEDEASAYTGWLKPEVISVDVAKSYKFIGAVNGEISLRVAVDLNGDGVIDEIESASDQLEKIPYFLTPADDANCTELLKVMMKNYVKNHSDNAELTTNLTAKIEACQNLTETQMLMATYFDFDVASTAGQPKVKEFEVPWDDL